MKDEFYQKAHNLTPDLIAQMLGSIKNDRSEEDLLWQAMIELGVPLDSKIYERDLLNQRVFFVPAFSGHDQNDMTSQESVDTKSYITPSKPLADKTRYKLIACLSRQDEIARDIALELYQYNTECVVFCEDGFQDDNAKFNVHETFKRLAPKIKLRVL